MFDLTICLLKLLNAQRPRWLRAWNRNGRVLIWTAWGPVVGIGGPAKTQEHIMPHSRRRSCRTLVGKGEARLKRDPKRDNVQANENVCLASCEWNGTRTPAFLGPAGMPVLEAYMWRVKTAIQQHTTREHPNSFEEHGGRTSFSVYQLFLINWKFDNNKNII